MNAPAAVHQPGQLVRWGLAALLLLGILLLYLLYPSADYTGDGTLFAELVRQFGHDGSTHYFRLFLHPHHLLYGPLAVGFMGLLGPPPEGMANHELVRLSHLSSLLGLLVLALVFVLLRRTTRSTSLPLAAVLLLAFAHSFWVFSESVEVQTLMLLTLSLFLTTLGLAPRNDRGAALLGMAHGAAMLGHVIQALLVLPALLFLLRPQARQPPRLDRETGGRILLYAACAVLTVAGPYLLAFPWVGVTSPADFVDYLRPAYTATDYVSSPIEGAARAAGSLPSLLLGPLPAAPPPETALVAARFALRFMLPAILLAPLLLRRRTTLDESALSLRRGAAWTLVAFLPLWTVWDAGNWEFLLLALPPGAVLLALAYHTRTSPGRGRITAAALLVGVALLLGSFHLLAVIGPQADPRNNPAWIRSEFVGYHSHPGDLILISGVGDYRAEKFYLRYLGRRRLVLQWKLLQMPAADVAASIQADLRAAWGADARLLVTSDVFEAGNLALLQERYGFNRGSLEDCLQGWQRRPLASLPQGFQIWELFPETAAPAGG